MPKNSMTVDKLNRINGKIQKLMNTPGGLVKALNKITSPLKTRRDVVSGVRKVFQYDPLTEGEVPKYDTDPDAYAYTVPHQGGAPMRLNPMEGRQVEAYMFDMIVYKEFPVSQLRRARYKLLKRIEQVLRNAIVLQEDTLMVDVLNAVVDDAQYPFDLTELQSQDLDPDVLTRAMGFIEDYTDASFVLMKARRASYVRTWGIDIFAPARREEILKTGVIGSLWNASLYKSRVFPDNYVYVTGDKEHVGRLPEYMSLTPLEIVSPKKGKQEIGMVQNIGFLCHNPYAVTRVELGVTP